MRTVGYERIKPCMCIWGVVQLAAVEAIILPQAQHSIVCSEKLQNPQIWVHSHAYAQTHKHMRKQAAEKKLAL